MRVLLAQRYRHNGRGICDGLRIDICAARGEGRQVQQVLVRMRVRLWFTVCARGRLVAGRNGIAERAVRQRPWRLARGRLKARLDGLREAADCGEGGFDGGRGVGDEVEAVAAFVSLERRVRDTATCGQIKTNIGCLPAVLHLAGFLHEQRRGRGWRAT